MTTTLRALAFGILAALVTDPAAAQPGGAAVPPPITSKTERWQVYRCDFTKATTDPAFRRVVGVYATKAEADRQALQLNVEARRAHNDKYVFGVVVVVADGPAAAQRQEFIDYVGGVAISSKKSEIGRGQDMVGGKAVDPKTTEIRRGQDVVGGKAVDPKTTEVGRGQDVVGGKAVDIKDAAERKLRAVEGAMNRAATEEQAAADVARAWAKGMAAVKSADGMPKDEGLKAVERAWAGFRDQLAKLPEADRRAAVDRLKETIPGFEQDAGRTAEDVYKKYYTPGGTFQKEAWTATARGYQTYKVTVLKMYRDQNAAVDAVDKTTGEFNTALERLEKVAARAAAGQSEDVTRSLLNTKWRSVYQDRSYSTYRFEQRDDGYYFVSSYFTPQGGQLSGGGEYGKYTAVRMGDIVIVTLKPVGERRRERVYTLKGDEMNSKDGYTPLKKQ